MTQRQQVRYLTASDGIRIAWAASGAGPLIVKGANWLTHLEDDWQSPIWRHWMQFFSSIGRFVRYDERGCGLSEWQPKSLSLDRWVDDLRSVIDAARPDGPFTLLGISQGAATCIQYALEHPDRVDRLILYGGYAHGAAKRGTLESRQTFNAMIDLARIGWGKSNATFRQVFTSRFIPGGSHEQLQWFNDLCAKTTTGDVVASLLEARAQVDISESLPKIRTPTLVLHARHDEVIPLAEGRLLASAIPNAEFVELDSANHILLEHEPAWQRFREAVVTFTGGSELTEASAFGSLSTRERQVLALIADGLSNTDIGDRLHISEKTVRNHASHIFDKLGVWSRAQAIVFARDHGFTQ